MTLLNAAALAGSSAPQSEAPPGSEIGPRRGGTASTHPPTDGAYLPFALRNHRPPPPFPRPDLAAATWTAVDGFATTHLSPARFPGYAPDAGGPSAGAARANVDAACHDFPDLPDVFGAGAHHAACHEWVAGYLALFHAARAMHADRAASAGAGRAPGADAERAADLRWSFAYFDQKLDHLEAFVYGPEDRPAGGASYRDTLAGVWQNPLRAIDVVMAASLLYRQGALDGARRDRAEELVLAVARAWYAAYRVAEPGSHPTTGEPLTTAAFPAIDVRSPAGRQVAPALGWTFRWDADKGNSPAEEVAASGLGAMLAGRVIGKRAADGGTLYAAGRHWVDYAIAYDSPDPVHGGPIRTLNAETAGGAYGQRRYWLENHATDVPSIPYLGYTWLMIGAALFASDQPGQAPWPSLVPDAERWRVYQLSAGETLRAPDGTFLVDWTPGRGIGYAVDAFPAWTMPCGAWRAGALYVRYDGRAGGEPLFVSEIGHPAGLDVINVAWPMLRLAAHRGDPDAYGRWEDRLRRVLGEYAARPPDPEWAVCQVTPYVSANPGYHTLRMLMVFVLAWLGLDGHVVEPWS